VSFFPAGAIHAQNCHIPDIPAGQLSRVIYAFADDTMRGLNVQDIRLACDEAARRSGSDLMAALPGSMKANDAQGPSLSQ
jgi:hypothetical protein